MTSHHGLNLYFCYNKGTYTPLDMFIDSTCEINPHNWLILKRIVFLLMRYNASVVCWIQFICQVPFSKYFLLYFGLLFCLYGQSWCFQCLLAEILGSIPIFRSASRCLQVHCLGRQQGCPWCLGPCYSGGKAGIDFLASISLAFVGIWGVNQQW